MSRFDAEELPAGSGRVILDIPREPYDDGQIWASLTPREARDLAGTLLAQAAAVERAEAQRHAEGSARESAVRHQVEVVHVRGDVYGVEVRGHHLAVDQPVDSGGSDSAPTPVELFVASLATCVAHYAGRYLDRHAFDRDGLTVDARYTMATDRPARVASVALRVNAPGVPPERVAGLLAVVQHCTVHNSLEHPPDVTFGITSALSPSPEEGERPKSTTAASRSLPVGAGAQAVRPCEPAPES
ncbi:OsmC family protein [Streptomyces sp. NPDC055099]